MAIKTKATQSSKKDTQAPAKKAPAKSATAAKPAAKPATKPAAKATTAKPAAKPATKAATTQKAPSKTAAKPVITAKPAASTGKTAYHVSKRDNDGREWKVFIQGSNKVIKLFGTQQEALDYAKSLCKNKDDGSYVLLHGLDGKIRKF